MRIGIAYSLKPGDRGRIDDGPDDRDEEFDAPETIDAIAEVIRGEGHDVVLLGDGREFLAKVMADPPDFVFNIAEGEGTSRNREARVPAVCEMLGIPYSGSDALTLGACLDKDMAKRLVEPKLDVPSGFVIEPEDFDTPDRIRSRLQRFCREQMGWFALMIKPALEGSSKGIGMKSLVEDERSAIATVERLGREYRQPILVEHFIPGSEVTVGLVGNGQDVTVLGSMRIVPKIQSSWFIYSLEVKRDWMNQVDYETPADLTRDVRALLHQRAKDAFRELRCRDVARIDFRLTEGVPFFIEANPLPGLSPTSSDLVILARGYGIDYHTLIRRILNAALSRVGLSKPN